MKKVLMHKFYKLILREYIFIILTATILFLNSASDSSAKENIFIIKDVKVEGSYNINFSRDKFIDLAFKKSFKKLSSNILLLEDINKLQNLSLKEIKTLVYSFKILEEKFKNNKYSAIYEISYNDNKIKKILSKKNISYYDPKSTRLVFFPVLFVNNEIKIFNDNYFYKNWINNKKNKSIKFLLPLEDLDEIASINKIKDDIEKINFIKLSRKYNTENYAVTIMSYKSNELKVYLKTYLDSKEYNKNITYKLDDMNNSKELNFIINDLKAKILDMWKRANLINIPLPLNITVEFKYRNPNKLNDLEKTISSIQMINNYSLEKFDNKRSYYKINYSGDPKKLSEEFFKLNYVLKNNHNSWELILND